MHTTTPPSRTRARVRRFDRPVLGTFAIGACLALALAGCDRGGPNDADSSDTAAPADGATGVPAATGASDPTDAAESVEQPWMTAATRPGTYHVRWRPVTEIESLEPFDVEVEVFQDAAMTTPVTTVDSVRVDAAMPHHRHGMNVEPEIESVADGRWIARGMLMHMLGRWEVMVDVERDGELERAQWTVTLK